MKHLRILLIDDDEDDFFLLKELISGQTTGRVLEKYDLDWVSTYEEAVKAFSACAHDVYLMDFHLGGRSGLDLLRETVVHECTAPVIILTGQGNYETDLAAMQLGAADYLEKGQLTALLLDRSIRYAVERGRNLAELHKQAQEIHALQKATSSLLNTLDLPRLMGQILDAALEAIPVADHGWISILERPEKYSDPLKEMVFSDPRIQRIQKNDLQDTPHDIILKGSPMLVQDAQRESMFFSKMIIEQYRDVIRSLIVAPLITMDEVIGSISISSSSPSAFSFDNLGMLTSIAATASAATYNAILYAETQKLATHDSLTGKFNRRMLFEYGQLEMDRYHRLGQNLSALMFDVDLFKKINDRYGHSVGDRILIEIAERCDQVIRNVDILGRYGGDEFVVLLPQTDMPTASEIADRIRMNVIKSPVNTDVGPIPVTISIGVAPASLDTSDFSGLLQKADQALYRSKQKGRNRISPAA